VRGGAADMRTSRLLLSAIAAVVIASPAWAANAKSVTMAAPDTADSTEIETVPFVNPGDQIGIACTALTRSDADSDVRVVLTISAAPGDEGPGYKKVLATDEQISHGAVRVRIPTAPDLEDRTVNVDVYVVDDKGTQSCDAGHMKIVRRAPSTHSLG
jgi:hypothetical protein